jgi:hypothetical protein
VRRFYSPLGISLALRAFPVTLDQRSGTPGGSFRIERTIRANVCDSATPPAPIIADIISARHSGYTCASRRVHAMCRQLAPLDFAAFTTAKRACARSLTTSFRRDLDPLTAASTNRRSSFVRNSSGMKARDAQHARSTRSNALPRSSRLHIDLRVISKHRNRR